MFKLCTEYLMRWCLYKSSNTKTKIPVTVSIKNIHITFPQLFFFDNEVFIGTGFCNFVFAAVIVLCSYFACASQRQSPCLLMQCSIYHENKWLILVFYMLKTLGLYLIIRLQRHRMIVFHGYSASHSCLHSPVWIL